MKRLLTAFGVAMAFAAGAAAQQLTFTPLRPDGIYRTGEKAGWKVTGSSTEPYTYTIKKNNMDTIKTGTLDLSSGAATIETTLDAPAMLYVDVAGPGGAATHLGAAVAPAKFEPSVPRPADFDAFWDSKLEELAEIPIHPVLAPEQTDVSNVDLFTVKLDSVGSHVQGYLAKPSREGKFPALVIYQYAGVYALQRKTVTDRAAEGWLAFDVDSHDLPPDEATGVPRNYQTLGNTDRETSYFLTMYLRDARAIDYIATRPDWDGKTIVIMGTSMGGQQSLVTAALRPKQVTAVIVNEPSGADSNGSPHGRKTGYPNWPSDNPKVMQTALYFDTVNFALRIQAPVLAAIGFIDTTAPPVGIYTAIDQIPGPAEVVPMIESAHNNVTPEKQGAYTARSEEVLDLILRGGQFHPR